MGSTLAEKVWKSHIVARGEDGAPDLLYIDLHLIHEVTSPQAFEGLRLAGREVRRPDLTIATEDHNVPTVDIDLPIMDKIAEEYPDLDASTLDLISYKMQKFVVRRWLLDEAQPAATPWDADPEFKLVM